MNPSVSVIVPAYNAEKTIERCVLSILAQTHADFEIIIVNDGSTDGTEQKVKNINDKRIKLINQKNTGQGLARNAGIKSAAGKYICFVDADDTINSDMLKKMLHKAEETSAEIVQCNITDIYENGNLKVQLGEMQGEINIEDGGEYIRQYMLLCKHSYEVCNKMFLGEFLHKNNLWFQDTKYVFSEDLLFNLEAVLYLRKICFLKEPLYNYYQSSESHLNSDREARLKGICNLFEVYFKNQMNKDVRIQAMRLATLIIMLYSASCMWEHKEFVKQILRQADVKEYIRISAQNAERFKNKALLEAIRILPMALKLRLIARYYTY